MCQSKARGGRRCKPNKGRRSSGAAAMARRTSSFALPAGTRRPRRVVLRDAQQQLGELRDSLVDATPLNSVAAAISAVDTDAAGQIADAITASLKANGWPRRKWRSHLVCGALAAVARAMEEGEDRAQALITQGVTTALASAGVPAPIAGMAARAAVDTLKKLTPYRHWDDIHRGVRLLAVVVCPAVENHREVVNYCLRPLASERLSGMIQQELAQLSGVGSEVTSLASARLADCNQTGMTSLEGFG
jgi:hypothetical protein